MIWRKQTRPLSSSVSLKYSSKKAVFSKNHENLAKPPKLQTPYFSIQILCLYEEN